jgi:hypothetical protein
MSTYLIARRIGTLAAATGAGLLGWAVAVPLAGIDLAVRQGGTVRPVGPAAVALACLVAGSVGWALLAVLERRLPPGRPRRTWLAVALVALAVSLAGPAGAVNLAGGIALAGLHLIVGAALIFGLASSARPRALPPALTLVGLATVTVALLPTLLPAL